MHLLVPDDTLLLETSRDGKQTDSSNEWRYCDNTEESFNTTAKLSADMSHFSNPPALQEMISLACRRRSSGNGSITD